MNGLIEQSSNLEETMLIGMYLLGKILTVKVLLKPLESGLGFAPSDIVIK